MLEALNSTKTTKNFAKAWHFSDAESENLKEEEDVWLAV
jgi:hypothetical protein